MSPKLKVLDLFSGIGGFSLGLERAGGFETVAFCEYDKKARLVLNKHWPDVAMYNDVRTLEYDGPVDVITGGYPCQPFSLAGKRKGKEDDRHLWPAMFSLIKKHRPAWVIGENVAGHVNMGLDDVLVDLGSEGYRTRVFVIPACAVDAKHRRDRVWIVGHTECPNEGRETNTGKPIKPTKTSKRMEQGRDEGGAEIMANSYRKRECDRSKEISKENGKIRQRDNNAKLSNAGEDVCYTASKGLQDGGNPPLGKSGSVAELERPGRYGSFWEPEPGVGRVANGIPNRVDRLKQLGNSVVPQIPEIIGAAILESIENEK